MSAPDFHESVWRSDGTGVDCPKCAGAGTTKPRQLIRGDKKSEAHFKAAAGKFETVFGPAGYGPACKNCKGTGKLHGE